mmetsp:Transcript_65974/g.121754  ORF Transcript_65974/g.121754 Transcript_65974/m.121754 type:complete len:97 (+) Transcript_65974:299-589(+)
MGEFPSAQYKLQVGHAGCQNTISKFSCWSKADNSMAPTARTFVSLLKFLLRSRKEALEPSSATFSETLSSLQVHELEGLVTLEDADERCGNFKPNA